jgi:peptide/nickel transport system permease protein
MSAIDLGAGSDTRSERWSALRGALIQLARQPRVWVGGVILLLAMLLAVFAPHIAPHDPLDQDLLHMLAPPMWAPDGSSAFPLGTDGLGRCVLSRAIYGARVALTVAVTAAWGSMLLGSTLALLAGYFGGAVDRLAVVLVDWTRFCRVVRADVLVTRRRDFVLAAQLLGFSHWRTMLREVLPAVVPLMITLFSIEMGVAIIVEATLSFIGLSVPPDITTWGQMLADARSDMQNAPWVLLTPVACIIVTVLACNLLGDGVRVALDPRLRLRAA